MKAQTKNELKKIAGTCSNIISGINGIIASIIRMILFSKYSVTIQSKKYSLLRHHDSCTILANGPSLKTAMENNEVRLEDVDIFCVNSFCESEYFWKIKPRYYCIIDGEFFHPTIERTKKQVATVVDALNKVEWELFLCISAHANNDGILLGLNNPNIKVLRFNTSTVVGYRWFEKLICKSGFGMLNCINVSVFAIMSAIRMKYNKIYMYGIDHSFTSQLFVDENNCVCSREQHVYSTEPRVFRLSDTTMAMILSDITQVFIIHEKLENYTKSMGVKIYNCTKGSFVDAYERL